MAKMYTHSDGYVCIYPEEQRCVGQKRYDEEDDRSQPRRRCRRRARIGLTVCPKHGADAPTPKAKSERIKAMADMRRFVTPIPGTDLEANPIAAFEMEFRRTIGRIRYLDEQLALLESDSLIWGVTKEVEQGSGEYPGTDTERAAQSNAYYAMQIGERKHLVDLIKIWIGAKLDIRKIEVEEQKVAVLNDVLVAVLKKLGHDVNSPEVRRIVRTEMLAIPVIGTETADVIATARDIVKTPQPLVRAAVALVPETEPLVAEIIPEDEDDEETDGI